MLYINEADLFKEREVAPSNVSQVSQEQHPTEPNKQETPHFKGELEYPELVSVLEDQLGGIPTHGSRNNFIFTMACHLRYVCNDEPSG